MRLIPGIACDAYILNDGTAVMSERGMAKFLNIDHTTLRSVVGNWPSKTLEPFIDEHLSVVGNYVEVTAKNSPHKNREIVVYSSMVVETIIQGYVLALAHGKLRGNQLHIGKRCALLSAALIRTALESAIKEACGVKELVQETAQRNFNAVSALKELGFKGTVIQQGETALEIATKKDIVKFFKIRAGTLNSFLAKSGADIAPIKLDVASIRSLGSNANHMLAYSLDSVAKIALWLDNEISVELKRRMFGEVGKWVNPDVKVEVSWRTFLEKICKDLGFHYSYNLGKYRVDYFIEKLGIVLECNGYEHIFYDANKEAEREKFLLQRYALIRFPHYVEVETLINAILKIKKRQKISLYDDVISLSRN